MNKLVILLVCVGCLTCDKPCDAQSINNPVWNKCYETRDITPSFTSPKSKIGDTPHLLRERMPRDVRSYIQRNGSDNVDTTIMNIVQNEAISIQKIILSSQFSLFVVHVQEAVLGNKYLVYLFDEKSKESGDPFIFDGFILQNEKRNSSGMPNIRHVDLLDIEKDGRFELVIREPRHNGTVYDGIVSHYLHYDHRYNLRELLAVETWSNAFIDDRRKLIHRTVTYSEIKREYKVSAFLVSGSDKKLIGQAWLYVVGNKVAVNKKAVKIARLGGQIITSSPMGEKTFLSRIGNE